MKVLLFGTTGMVGQSALRACLADPGVTEVLSVGRTPSQEQHTKFRELIARDLFDLGAIESELAGFDACFFCLGVSSAGMSESDYRRVTYELTLSIAKRVLEHSPDCTFIYVSGEGTDAHGRAMWARVKGETERALLQLPFKAAFMFRPGFIQPEHGVRSKTRLYQLAYTLTAPLFPLIERLAAAHVTTSDRVGRAMLEAVRHGAPRPCLENTDINTLAELATN